MHITHGLAPGQVLQRRRNQTATTTITGTCSHTGPVRATIRKGASTVRGWTGRTVGRASHGKFTAKLGGVPVGGPYTITLSTGAESLVVLRIFVGDVWVLGGQSNMQGCGRLRHAPSPHPLVHAMYMDRRWDVAREPIHFLAESPDPVHTNPPYSAARIRQLKRGNTHGVGPSIYFAREMVRRSGGVPQGLICVAHGGTSMSQWDPSLKGKGGASLYGSMMLSFRHAGQPVAGMLWYQGESDANEADAPLFTRRMKRFVAAIRRDFKQRDLPFIMVQLGRVFGANWPAAPWNSIQNQQYRLKEHIRHVECVPAVDLPLDDPIHVSPAGFARLGVRLARMADRLVYGNRRELPPPEIASVRRMRNSRANPLCMYGLVVNFRNAVGGLRAHGLPAGFSLVTSDHRDSEHVFRTEVSGNQVFLETNLAENSGEFTLMHGHGRFPHVNITDGRDMPIPVIGPLIAETTTAICPFVSHWLASEIQKPAVPLKAMRPPRPTRDLRLKKYGLTMNFLDMHEVWKGRPGVCLFFSEVRLDEAMKLNLRVGSDGPIRVWIDNRPMVQDLNATNPAILDTHIRPLSLRKGRHRISVAMDLNEGRAWGFYLRFSRRDVGRNRIINRAYAVPVCCLK